MQLFPSSVSFFGDYLVIHQRRRLTECSDDMHQLATVVNSAVAANKPVVLVVDECHQLIQDKGLIARRLSSRFWRV